MNNLTELVPLLDLCKQIPKGQFADSVLAWDSDYETWFVRPRIEVEPLIAIPAPTLAEIMPECGNTFYMWNDGKGWKVFCHANLKILRNYDPNSAPPALKLWMQLEAGK